MNAGYSSGGEANNHNNGNNGGGYHNYHYDDSAFLERDEDGITDLEGQQIKIGGGINNGSYEGPDGDQEDDDYNGN